LKELKGKKITDGEVLSMFNRIQGRVRSGYTMTAEDREWVELAVKRFPESSKIAEFVKEQNMAREKE